MYLFQENGLFLHVGRERIELGEEKITKVSFPVKKKKKKKSCPLIIDVLRRT